MIVGCGVDDTRSVGYGVRVGPEVGGDPTKVIVGGNVMVGLRVYVILGVNVREGSTNVRVGADVTEGMGVQDGGSVKPTIGVSVGPPGVTDGVSVTVGIGLRV